MQKEPDRARSPSPLRTPSASPVSIDSSRIMPRVWITSPSATSWSPGSMCDDVAGHHFARHQLDHRAVPRHLRVRSDQHRQLVEGRLCLQLLADPDVGVDHRDQPEQRVRVQPERHVEDEEDADDRVEQREDVAGDDA